MVEKLDKDMIEAMKSKDKDRLVVIRMVKAALKQEQIDHKKEINDDLLIDVVNKQIKMRKDSITEFEKGNSNINGIIDNLDQDQQNQITMIMAEDYEIEDLEKAIDDIIQAYKRDKLNNRKFEILEKLEQTSNIEEKRELEKELSNIIITLARIK